MWPLILIFSYLNSANCGTCNQPTQIYEEFGCTPIYKGSSPCPEEFNCDNVFKRDKSKCFFQGKLYENENRIDEPGLKRICHLSCGCSESRIICAMPGCFIPPEEGCSIGYDEIDQCCPSKSVCPSNKTIECKYKGESYYEGQRFNKDINEMCLCKRNGCLECVRNKCFVELYDQDKVDGRCAPVYDKNSECPRMWLCPSESDVIISSSKPLGPKCQYGKRILSKGSVVKSSDKKIYCKCVISPFLTCYFD